MNEETGEIVEKESDENVSKDQVKALKERIRELESQFDERVPLEQTIEVQKNRLNDKEQEIRYLEDKIKELNEKINMLSNKGSSESSEKIESLRKENKDLSETIKLLKDDISKLNTKKNELKEKLRTVDSETANKKDLERKINTLKEEKADLKRKYQKQSTILKEYKTKLENFRHDSAEKDQLIEEQNKKIQTMDKTISRLEERVKSIDNYREQINFNKLKLKQYKEENKELKQEIANFSKMIESFEEFPSAEIQKDIKISQESTREQIMPEKVIQEKGSIKEDETDEIEGFEKEREEKIKVSSIEDTFESTIRQQSPIQKDNKVIEVGRSPEHRRTCPVCGNQKHIRELTDKNKIISIYPRMYGKKFQCGQCGAEWR